MNSLFALWMMEAFLVLWGFSFGFAFIHVPFLLVAFFSNFYECSTYRSVSVNCFFHSNDQFHSCSFYKER